MTAIDAKGRKLGVNIKVRRVTVDGLKGIRAWGGSIHPDGRLGGENLGVVEHVVGHAVVTEKGVFCGRLVVRT